MKKSLLDKLLGELFFIVTSNHFIHFLNSISEIFFFIFWNYEK